MQQEKIATSGYFLTLTYDTNHVHITKNGFMGLNKRDLQLFFKRLRKANDSWCKRNNCGNPPLKYYAVGEYGGRTFRPHYHVILFNSRLELIQDAWQLGQVHYGTVSGASVGYTLKYISKPSRIPLHRNDDRLKEFSLMSKGIGANYLTAKMLKWHLEDIENRQYVNVGDGKKAAIPRYLREKIYDSETKGYLKGFNEVKRELDMQEAIRTGKLTNLRDSEEAVKAAFRKMHMADTKNKI